MLDKGNLEYLRAVIEGCSTEFYRGEGGERAAYKLSEALLYLIDMMINEEDTTGVTRQ